MVRLAYLLVFAVASVVFVNAQANTVSNASSNSLSSLPSNTVYNASDKASSASSNSIRQYSTNLTISNVYVPPNISIHSPLPLSFNMTNTGKYASGNIMLTIEDYGVSLYNTSISITPLSPGQSTSIFLYLNGITGAVGRHSVYISSAYTSNGKIYTGGGGSTDYNVTNTGFAGAQPNFNAQLPSLEIESVPFVYYLDSQIGGQVSQLQLLYTGLKPTTVDMNVPGIFSGLVSLSSHSLYMQQNQTLGSSLLINTGHEPYETTYVLPISISIANGSRKFMNDTYMELSVLNVSTNSTFVSEQSSLLNGSTDISGVLQINSPAYAGLDNVEVEFLVPQSVGSSLSRISTYGSATNVTQVNGSYVMSWNVGDIANNQNVYLYYDIGGIENASAFLNSKTIMYSVSHQIQGNLFTIISKSLPILYTNSTTQLNLTLLYTGTVSSRALVTLPSSPGAKVSRSVRVVNVTPNQQINLDYNMTSTNYTGTIPMKLYIVAEGINSTYNVPIIVVAAPQSVFSIAFGTLSRFKYFVLTIILAIAAVLAYRYRKRREPVEYNEDRAKSLIEIREQMKREDEGSKIA
jgi:hypothetical protein